MPDISINELFEFYLETIDAACCASIVKDESERDYLLFEVFDVGVVTFLHDKNLTRLRNHDLISAEQMDKSIRVRCMWQQLVASDDAFSERASDKTRSAENDFYRACNELHKTLKFVSS